VNGKLYSERMLAVMVLGSVAFHAGQQGMLEDSSLLKRSSEVIKKAAKDEDVYVRVWAGKAASRLAIAQPLAVMEGGVTMRLLDNKVNWFHGLRSTLSRDGLCLQSLGSPFLIISARWLFPCFRVPPCAGCASRAGSDQWGSAACPDVLEEDRRCPCDSA
jgi:hypothetical protein